MWAIDCGARFVDDARVNSINPLDAATCLFLLTVLQ
jgi:hypothetical protein